MSVRLIISMEALALLQRLQVDPECARVEWFPATKFAGVSLCLRDELMHAGYLRRTQRGYRLTKADEPMRAGRAA